MDTIYESAIPEQLRRTRHCPLAMKRSWTPPYPSFSARFDPERGAVAMIVLGLQHRGDTASIRRVESTVDTMLSMIDAAGHVGFRDQAEFTDSAGLRNRIIIAYRYAEIARESGAEGRSAEDRSVECAGAAGNSGRPAGDNDDNSGNSVGFAALRNEWFALAQNLPEIGCYVERLHPSLDRVETLYSSHHLQGVAHLAVTLSGEICEHGYWGSARDRMPAAQTDALDPRVGRVESSSLHPIGGDSARSTFEGEAEEEILVRVRDFDNLCLIRSGQDWSATAGEEREMYIAEVEPTLREGMDFLTKDGRDIGCIANRYARVLDDRGVEIDQSYGMSWWTSLRALDDWAREHPSHQAIFGVAMRYLAAHGGSGHLKLTHEVFVLDRAQGIFEYLRCHPGTGLLAAVGTAVV